MIGEEKKTRNMTTINGLLLFCTATLIFVLFKLKPHSIWNADYLPMKLEALSTKFEASSMKSEATSMKFEASSRLIGKQACIHPVLDTNDPFMMSFMKKFPVTNCSTSDENTNWVYVQNGTLHFTKQAVIAHKNINCDYHPLLRDGDSKIKFDDPIENISNPFAIRDDAFKITCRGGDGKSYSNMHQGIAFRKEFAERKQDSLKDGLEGLSIAVLGFDSMSRMSWLRRLPITRKYFVEKLGAIELEQYNILGEGTTAALIPILTGKFEWELPECRLRHTGAKPMDNFPWIWRDFKKAGYLTSFSNADTKGAVFNWRMLGFTDQPTDFYSRKFYLAAEPLYRKGRKKCLGSLSRPALWLNWFRDMFHMYKHQRKFLFNFYPDLSHNNNNPLTEMDEPIQKLVEHLHDDGYLNNTLLVLMGDHGARYSTNRNTIPGKIEERLPYFSFLFPPWFIKKYPHAIQNLRTNTKRLTTPLDIHETFKDFLHFKGTGKGSVKNRAISLFQEIPLSRTCADAAVASHWCACLDLLPLPPTDTYAQRALQTAINTINSYTEENRDLCAKLTVDIVKSVFVQKFSDDILKFLSAKPGDIHDFNMSSKNKNGHIIYQLSFVTSPGGGSFEVTVHRDVIRDQFTMNDREISRTNKYGNAPDCVKHRNRQISPYCYCKHLLV